MIILIQFEYNIKEKWIIHEYSIFSPIISIFWWWWHAVNLQGLTSTITVNMPYEFDKELWELIVEIRGIWKDLLSMQLELFGSFPSTTSVPLINYLVINCILQANKIQHDLLDLRLEIMLEKDLSSLIHPHNVTWPGYYVHLILLWSLSCPPPLQLMTLIMIPMCSLLIYHLLNCEISVNVQTM